MVADDFDGLMQAAGEVEGVPGGEVAGQGVDVDDAVFNEL